MEKGSAYWLKRFINEQPYVLNTTILLNSPSLLSFVHEDLSIEWKSPILEYNYKEFRNDFLLLDESWKEKKVVLDKEWARIGPQWDGLAIVRGKKGQKGILLVEAKAHVHELNSKMRAGSDSAKRITKAIQETKQSFGSFSPLHPWTDKYYQLSNRLTYLRLLNEELNIPAWLIVVNFVEDQTHISTKKYEWIKHYQQVFNDLDLNGNSPNFSKLVTIFPQVSLEFDKNEGEKHAVRLPETL